MAFTTKGALHAWAAASIVRNNVAVALVQQAEKQPQRVVEALRGDPTLLAGVGRQVQRDMYQQLAARGLTAELADIAGQKTTPRAARSLIADIVLKGVAVPTPTPNHA